MSEQSLENSILVSELKRMNIDPTSIEIIRNKDGVQTFRVSENGKHYFLKYFEKLEFRREIANYKILRDLNIPTISVIGFTDSSLLLEDINYSKYRLCTEEDLHNFEIIKLISKWYKKLHINGFNYSHKNNLYSELDLFSRENLKFLLDNNDIEQIPILEVIYKKYDFFRNHINSLEATLTYNDFHYSNIAISRDMSSVIIFDYNFLGRGCISSDIYNVLWQLKNNELKRIFLNEYGEINQSERAIIDIVNPIIGLFIAHQKIKFPCWGNQLLDTLSSYNYYKMVNDFLSNI